MCFSVCVYACVFFHEGGRFMMFVCVCLCVCVFFVNMCFYVNVCKFVGVFMIMVPCMSVWCVLFLYIFVCLCM